MNKLFCREGRFHSIENFNALLKVGLLQRSFPALTEVLYKDEKIRQWLNLELRFLSHSERPSLNYVYSVFIACLALKLRKTPQAVIQSNLLFSINFKELNPTDFLKAAFSSWEQFLKEQTVSLHLPKVDVNFNINLNVQINQFHYVNVEGRGQTFFTEQQQASTKQQAQFPLAHSPRL